MLNTQKLCISFLHSITVVPADAVTSIMQSPVLKGHIFIVLSWKISCELNLFKKSPDLSHKSPFLCPKCDLLRQSDCILLLYMLYDKVFQRRTDGSTDFYRDWSAYEDGFGDRKEFWLGDYLWAHWKLSKYIRARVIYPFNMMIVLHSRTWGRNHDWCHMWSSRLFQFLVFCVMFCRSFFVLLSFFVWSLYCPSFFHLRLLINPLVSSSFSAVWLRYSYLCVLYINENPRLTDFFKFLMSLSFRPL
jgi:hypothetical protein